jgi:transposase-like protein
MEEGNMEAPSWITLKKYTAGEKVRIVLAGLREKNTIAELCRGKDQPVR